MSSPVSARCTGNTGLSIRLGMRSTTEITERDQFSSFLNSCGAIRVNTSQSTIIQIGKPGSDKTETKETFTVDGRKVEIILYHGSYNYGVSTDRENVTINLNGSEKVIQKILFTKANLDLAFDMISKIE